MKLNRKTAVVTGSSDGLGKQIALKLAKEKVSLALVARSKEKLETVAKEATKLGSPKVKIYPCDLKDSKRVTKTVKQILGDLPQVQILVNSAGVWQKQDYTENLSEEIVTDVIQANLTGLINITRLFLPVLKKQPESAIINVSSRSGVKAQEKQSVYTASKWGVTGFTEVLKAELAKTSVRVAGIYQGGVNTDMFRKTGENFDQSYFIKPEDLADVIVFMLSRPQQIWLHDVRVEY